MNKKIVSVCVATGLSLFVGCESLDVDPMAHMVFKSRAVVEDMPDDDISVNGAESMAAMKKERKLQIAVAADVLDQSMGRAAADKEKLQSSAQAIARVYLGNVKAYKLEAVSFEDLNRTLKTGDDINGVTFPFLCKIKAILTSETVKKSRSDQIEYKCVLTWELIDNRTKDNGLGDLPTPEVVASMVCQNVTARQLKLSVTGASIGGDDLANAQSAYNVVMGNCMSQFYAQLANRIPFGGAVSEMKTLDGDVYVNIKADAKGQGVVKKMQMLIVNDDLDRIAVGEVITSANGKSNIKIWRWLSKSYRKQLEDVAAKGKDAVDEWLDENSIYALCLGLPEQDKDVLLDYRSRK